MSPAPSRSTRRRWSASPRRRRGALPIGTALPRSAERDRARGGDLSAGGRPRRQERRSGGGAGRPLRKDRAQDGAGGALAAPFVVGGVAGRAGAGGDAAGGGAGR